MKKFCFALALAGALLAQHLQAISLDNIQLWTGSGTNRAALVIDWNTPQIINNGNTVPVPVANKTMVWGYKFNGMATATEMFNAVVAADRRLYTVEYIDPTYGTEVDAIGYNLNAEGIAGVTDGSITDAPSAFNNGVLIDPNLNVDSAQSLNGGDLFWSGFAGPYWQLWNETNDAGGFFNSPNIGTNEYMNPNTYSQGQWVSAYSGLDFLDLTNGSWIGFSVSACGYDSDTNDAAYYVFNNNEQAPASPDGTYVAYVCNTNDFATEVISTTNLYTSSPYNNPAAVLSRPTLDFLDGAPTDHVSLVNPPYNVTPAHADVITEIKTAGEITVQLGRKVYHDPNNPYGADLIVYGNAFYDSISGGAVNAATDMNTLVLKSSAIFGHPTIVSVSQDNINWYTLPTYTPSYILPDEAYRWDDTNSWWTAEQLNPNKPIDPFIYTNNFANESVAEAVDQFAGASGGTEYSLASTGLPWIQYVRLQPTGSEAVIDAIAAVDPVSVGDALAITPDNVTAGVGTLAFQNPGNSSQNQISINFDSVNELARISTVSLSDFSSFAPVTGSVSSGYQIQALPITSTNAVVATADVGLYAGANYTGNGNDLRVYQWESTNWTSEPFAYNPTNNEVLVSGLTNLSAFVVSQIVPPNVVIQTTTNGFAFQFTPVPNCQEVLERSTDLINWTNIYTFTATNGQPMTLQDTNVPGGQAYYRVYATVP
ncbi:MAG TPA: hypothetical protein VGN23_12860 [Verrucomicrobiae bacterium]